MKNYIFGFAAAVGLVSNLVACSSDDTSAAPGSVTATTVQAGSLATEISIAGTIVGVGGTYGEQCARLGYGQTPSDRWAANVNERSWDEIGPAAPADPVTVIAGNVDCRLLIDTLYTVDEDDQPAPYTSQTPITLDTSFQAVTTFSGEAGTFGVAAEISALTYRADFGIQVVVSTLGTDQRRTYSDWQLVSSNDVVASDVPAPLNYVSTGEIETEVDINRQITTATGFASIESDGDENDAFLVLDGDYTEATYPDLDALYQASIALPTKNVYYLSELEDDQLDVSAFDLVGSDLSEVPATRTVLFANTDKDSGVTSYQVVTLRFYAPRQPD